MIIYKTDKKFYIFYIITLILVSGLFIFISYRYFNFDTLLNDQNLNTNPKFINSDNIEVYKSININNIR